MNKCKKCGNDCTHSMDNYCSEECRIEAEETPKGCLWIFPIARSVGRVAAFVVFHVRNIFSTKK